MVSRVPFRVSSHVPYAVVITLALSACTGREVPRAGEGEEDVASPFRVRSRVQPGFAIGEEAPDFTLMVLRRDGFEGEVGNVVSLSDYRGQVVVVDFWNTGCAPCLHEHDTLVSVAQEYRERGVRFLGITGHDSQASLDRFVERFGAFAYPQLDDPGDEVMDLYRARGWPTKVVLDREGRVAWWKAGGPVERVVLTGVLDDVLEGRRPDGRRP